MCLLCKSNLQLYIEKEEEEVIKRNIYYDKKLNINK